MRQALRTIARNQPVTGLRVCSTRPNATLAQRLAACPDPLNVVIDRLCADLADLAQPVAALARPGARLPAPRLVPAPLDAATAFPPVPTAPARPALAGSRRAQARVAAGAANRRVA